MSLFNLFSSAPKAEAQQQQTAQQQQDAKPTPGNIPEGAGVSNNPPAPNTETKVESPLDAFSGLWDTTNNAGSDASDAPYFNVKPEDLAQAASTVDFSKVINKETASKIASGGEEAVAAFMESMNKVAQSVYAQSTLAAMTVAEKAARKANSQVMDQLPSAIRKQSVSESLRTENPALQHPAAQPILQALEHQLGLKYPNATSAEIKQHAQKYLSGFAALANPASPATSQNAKQEDDWEKFFS